MKKRLINFKFIMTIAIIEILCYMAVDMYLASMTDISEYFWDILLKSTTFTYFLSICNGNWTAFLWFRFLDFLGRKIPLIGYLGTFGKNATKNFKLTLKSDTLLYEPLELIFPYKDTLSTPKTISSSIS